MYNGRQCSVFVPFINATGMGVSEMAKETKSLYFVYVQNPDWKTLKFLRPTKAVSEDQARNNVRWALFGETPEDELLPFVAILQTQKIPKRSRSRRARQENRPKQLFLAGIPSNQNAMIL